MCVCVCVGHTHSDNVQGLDTEFANCLVLVAHQLQQVLWSLCQPPRVKGPQHSQTEYANVEIGNLKPICDTQCKVQTAQWGSSESKVYTLFHRLSLKMVKHTVKHAQLIPTTHNRMWTLGYGSWTVLLVWLPGAVQGSRTRRLFAAPAHLPPVSLFNKHNNDGNTCALNRPLFTREWQGISL